MGKRGGKKGIGGQKLDLHTSKCYSIKIGSESCFNVFVSCHLGEDSYEKLVEAITKRKVGADAELVLITYEEMDPCTILAAYLHSLDADALGKRRARVFEFEVLMRIYGKTQINELLNMLKKSSSDEKRACLHLVKYGKCCTPYIEKCNNDTYETVLKTHLELIS